MRYASNAATFKNKWEAAGPERLKNLGEFNPEKLENGIIF